MIPQLVTAVGAVQQIRKDALFAILRFRRTALCPLDDLLLYLLKGVPVDNRLVNILEDDPVFFRVIDAGLKNVTMATLWTSLGIIVASLIVTIAINMKATMLQTRAGYRACANKRIEIAEHLRYLPMGWFNDNSLGEVTSVTTNTMENMANVATRVVMVTTRGFLTSGIIAVMMFLFDWRMGLITLAGLVLFFAVNAAMQRAEQALSQRKFNADERLVSKVLEYVQGIAEVKNFDLTYDSATKVHGAVEEARKASFAMELPSVLYMLAQFIVNKLTGVAVCTAAIVFYFGGTMKLTNCLLMLICSFILFEQLDSAGSFSALFRSIDIGVDKASAILRIEPMDIDGEELTPEREDITLSHVDFSYDSKPILHDVSLTIPEKATVAIVGPSGSGKTTLCNLMARFWDVQGGSVRHADQIFVVDHGEIVQQGTHDELVAVDGLYRRFVVERQQAAGWKV